MTDPIADCNAAHTTTRATYAATLVALDAARAAHIAASRAVGDANRLTAAEADRDEALVTLAAARTMLDATGEALAEATKRIAALEAERDAAIAEIERLKEEVGELMAELAYRGVYP